MEFLSREHRLFPLAEYAIMKCPKCHGELAEQTFLTQSGEVVIDKCKRCAGIWFDKGEAELLRDDWTSVSVDDGDQFLGMIYNEIRNIDCPRCQQPMKSINDPKQTHILYEICPERGFFMDAGEFSDFRKLSVKEAFDYILDMYRKDHPDDTF
jgi:Zn-finger nucleic acid-binding protein